MRILYVSLTYRPAIGGVATAMHELAQRLRARGHEVLAHTLGLPLMMEDFAIEGPDDNYEWEGIPVRRIPFQRALRRQVYWRTIAAIMRRRHHTQVLGKMLGDQLGEPKVDLIHVFMVTWQDACAGFALARRLGVPVVFTPHLHPGPMDWVRQYCRPLLKKAAAVIALTEFERKIYLEEGVKPERVYRTGVAPDLAPQADGARFRTQHNIKGPLILFLARMVLHKNYPAVAKAAKYVWQEFPEATFVFIGPGLGVAHWFFARQKDPRIRHLGKVPLSEKTDALAACDLLCVPSGVESFGGMFCEAWTMGKPVIGGDVPAVRELIEASQGGMLVKVWLPRPKEIAQRIVELLRDEKLRKKMGESGRALVQKRYSWDALAGQTERIYQDVVGRS